jgi:hypothetical protein
VLASGRLVLALYGRSELQQPWPSRQKIGGVVGIAYDGDTWRLAKVACASPSLCNIKAQVFTAHVTESVMAELPGKPAGRLMLSSRTDRKHTIIRLEHGRRRHAASEMAAPPGVLLADAGGNMGGQ